MNTLVSVIVVTYNSSDFIIETLDSVLKQTYENIELIITDDCSKDKTIELCYAWLKQFGQRFINTNLVTSKINTGVAANANRGIRSAKGDWIKSLGGDDTLKPDCIENNVSFLIDHPEIKVLFSQVEVYRDTFMPQNLIKITPGIPYDPKGILAPDRNAGSQYRMLLKSDRIHFTPSVFIHRRTLLSVGGYDERFKLLEDYPLWLNLTKKGIKLYFMEKVTVNYRKHSQAINNTNADYLVNPNYFKAEEFRRIYTYPYLPIDIRLIQRFHWYTSQLFQYRWLNKNNSANKFLLLLLTSYLNPFKYFVRLRVLLNSNLKKNEFYI